jgi:ubiquinone/menaquinone biosynthesis C-methylase UbiE
MKNTTVDENLQSLYNDYYHDNHRTLVKRELTALDTIQHIQSVCDISRMQKVLDVGAGEGSLLECLAKLDCELELYGVEISASGIDTIKSKEISKVVEVLQFDGYKIPYPDKYFDLAICIHVLEHVEHERVFIRELNRVASRVIIEVPLEHTMRVSRAIKGGKLHGHINFYTVDTLLNVVETCSMKVLKYKVLTFSQDFERFLYGTFKGFIKNRIRSIFLSLFPKLAPNIMVYFCILLCEDSKVD